MLDKRIAIHAAFVLLLPLVVAGFGLSFLTTLLLVILGLLWRWALVWLQMFGAGKGPNLVLETISVSHFAEKVRWCLDRYGRNLQVWIYYHLLGERELCTHLWGANCPQTPWWQRGVIRIVYPLQTFLISKTFQISPAHYRKSSEHIETLLGDVEGRLADGRGSVLGGDEINYTDIAFASLSGVWMQPEDYGGGAADGVRVDRERFPGAMRDDMERWAKAYPLAAGFVERLYLEERRPERPTAE